MNGVKIIPGRGLSGRDIKKRLQNRTLSLETFGQDAYLLDENMDKFVKMSRVEQIEHMKDNNKKINQMQRKLDTETNEKRRREQEQAIEREIQNRMKEIGKQQTQQTQNTNQ